MRILERLRTVLAIARGGGASDVLRLLRRRPGLLLGVNAYEVGLIVSNRLDARLKTLAQVKTSALVGCPL